MDLNEKAIVQQSFRFRIGKIKASIGSTFIFSLLFGIGSNILINNYHVYGWFFFLIVLFLIIFTNEKIVIFTNKSEVLKRKGDRIPRDIVFPMKVLSIVFSLTGLVLGSFIIEEDLFVQAGIIQYIFITIFNRHFNVRLRWFLLRNIISQIKAVNKYSQQDKPTLRSGLPLL